MVKTVLAATVCGLLALSHASAQEVMIGRASAPNPQYPKAEVVRPNAVAAAPNKVAAQPPKKTAETTKVATKEPEPPALGPSEKPHAAPAPGKKPATSVATSTSSTKGPANDKTITVTQQKPAANAKPAASPAAPAHKTDGLTADSKKTTTPPVSTKPATIVAEQKPSPAPKIPAVAIPPATKKTETHVVSTAKVSASPAPLKKSETQVASTAKVSPSPAPSKKIETQFASTAKPGPSPEAAKPIVRTEPVKKPAVNVANVSSSVATPAETTSSQIQPANNRFDTAFTKLADGFDFPVGKPDAQGYYKARGFRAHGHMGEDWDGVGGGDTDLGDPVSCIGDGIVVFARDCHMGWGNVIIVRHSFREGGTVKSIDSLYGHLNNMLVRRGQTVMRGQKIATIGTAHGLYDAHLHLEVRKNIEIGMSRAAFAQDFSNYYDPTTFIQTHRHLANGGGNYRVAMNTFTHDARIAWDKARNYSHSRSGGGTGESSVALKKALAAKH